MPIIDGASTSTLIVLKNKKAYSIAVSYTHLDVYKRQSQTSTFLKIGGKSLEKLREYFKPQNFRYFGKTA